MLVFCAEARRTVTHRRTATTALMVRRAPVRWHDFLSHHFAVLRVSSRLFACFACFASTSWLSDRSEAAAGPAVRAKSAKIAKNSNTMNGVPTCSGEDAPLDREARSTT